jgi:type II secretory pathway component PulK
MPRQTKPSAELWILAGNERGIALITTIIFILMITMMVAISLSASVGQKMSTDTVSGYRLRDYYKVRAGLVDARERIFRNDTLSTPALVPAGSFTTAAYNPNAYQLDIDGGGADVNIDISAEAANGLRTIVVTSIGS